MIYDRGKPGDGVWHCPFSKEWVDRMKRAAKHCEPLTESQIEMSLCRIDNGYYYELPPGDFLSEPQDARGLPMSYVRDYERRHARWPVGCSSIYDYDSIPEMVITNGKNDWPLEIRGFVLTA